MVEKQIKEWSIDLFMNDDDEFTEEVTSVAVSDSGVYKYVSQFFMVTVMLLAVEKHHKKGRYHVTFQLSCTP